MRILGVDVSHWQRKIKWAILRDGGVRFATMKTSQGDYITDEMLVTHVNDAEAGKIEVLGGYHWDDPIIAVDRQIQRVEAAVKDLPLRYLYVDAEQWWTDWAAWRAWLKDRSKPKPKAFDPVKLSEHTRLLTEGLARALPKLVIGVYTRTSFINEYAPRMASWLKPWRLYLAEYPFAAGVVRTSWETLQRDWLPTEAWKPRLPVGIPRCPLIQVSGDKFVLPGYESVLDLDCFFGTEEEFRQYFNIAGATPVLSDKEKLDILWRDHYGER